MTRPRRLPSRGRASALVSVSIAVGTIVATGWGWHSFQHGIEQNAHSALPPAVALEGTGTRTAASQPFRVLVVGDGYAAGAGASEPASAWPAVLARATGWAVDVVAARGAGLVASGPGGFTLPELFAQAIEGSPEPDLVIIQGGLAAPTDLSLVPEAIRELGQAIRSDFPEPDIVVVTSFRDSGRQESVTAKAWKGLEGITLLRPQREAWPPVAAIRSGGTDDAGHATIAAEIEEALTSAGLPLNSSQVQ